MMETIATAISIAVIIAGTIVTIFTKRSSYTLMLIRTDIDKLKQDTDQMRVYQNNLRDQIVASNINQATVLERLNTLCSQMAELKATFSAEINSIRRSK
jgi:IS1 family transposase